MLHYFRTEEEFLEIYRELFKKYREGYYIPFSGVDRDLSDFVSQGYKKFGYDTMVWKLEKKMKLIAEEVDKEIGWATRKQI